MLGPNQRVYVSPVANCPGQDAKQPSEDEAAARELIRDQIPGELVHIDPPDFAICRDDVIVGAVEVTRFTDERLIRLCAQLDHQGQSIESDALSSSWILSLSWSPIDLRRLRANIAKVLLSHEATGVSSGDTTSDEMRALGVTSAFRFDGVATPSRRIYLQPEPRFAWANPNAVDEAIMDAAMRKRKALVRVKGERHLFVWIDPWNVEAAFALGGEPADHPPPLPDWVDEVWVAPAAFDANPQLWHRAADRAWTVVAEG